MRKQARPTGEEANSISFLVGDRFAIIYVIMVGEAANSRPTGEEALSGLDCKERVRQRTLDQRERKLTR
jgi:hypothetical protein